MGCAAITILSDKDGDYISLTDMLKAKDGEFFIADWLRNRNTVEFLGIWESVFNPGFNYGEFAIIRSQAGLNSYKISVKEWVEKTNAVGLKATPGRYGGTYAHPDIAFEFGMWISPEFKIYLIKEFRRLKEDENRRLTDLTEALQGLPKSHDALWDLFREVTNKKDEEAFELALEKPERREDFYTKLSKFCRFLKMGLSSIHWVTATPADTAERYKRDAVFFQKLRASVKIRYAEEIDYRDYEAQIQKMLTTYVQADEIIQVVDPVNIFERQAFEKEVEKARSPRAKADIIANRTKKTITEKMEEDPFFYRKFSLLLEQTIADYRQQRISEAQYLAKVKEIMESVRDRRKSNLPSSLEGNDFAQALYGAVSEQLSPDAGRVVRESSAPYGSAMLSEDAVIDQIRAEMSLRMEEIIRNEAVVRWRDNPDAQNRMRNQMDDFLFQLKSTRGITLSLEQMDSLIESCLRIARNRPNDV